MPALVGAQTQPGLPVGLGYPFIQDSECVLSNLGSLSSCSLDVKFSSFPYLPIDSLLTCKVQFKPDIPQGHFSRPLTQNYFPFNSKSQGLFPSLPSHGDNYDSVITMHSWRTEPLSCSFLCVLHTI